MKLISMTKFIEHQNMEEPYNFKGKVLKYSRFLKQPLKLEMFVPCDDEGNVLEQPIYTTNHSDECYCKRCEEETKRCSDLQDQYRKVKEKVLFKGFKPPVVNNTLFLHEHHIYYSNGEICENDNGRSLKTIEDLIQYADLILTQNATKQFL